MRAEAARLPSWFVQPPPEQQALTRMKSLLREGHLHTVCQSARCPNMNQCWARGVATFMILGDVCTRACRFCAVKAGRPLPVDEQEPEAVARTVEALGVTYVVVTSVTRDDLPDEGAGQFARTVRAIRRRVPGVKIEVLIPDCSGRVELLREITGAAPEVIGHNMETVERLSPEVRPQAEYHRSLAVLRDLRRLAGKDVYIKTGFMVGIGETEEEVLALMRDIRDTGCEMLTIGQYLAPTGSPRHVRTRRFVSPEEFEAFKRAGEAMGFSHVMSGPLVRSSYIADQGYREVTRDRKA